MKFSKSEELYKRAIELSPAGSHSAARLAPLMGRFEGRPEMPSVNYPKFIDHAFGSHIYDVDGNDFIDYCLGLGPVILGHCYPAVNQAVKRQIDRGVIYAMDHEQEIELCELLKKHIPCAEIINLMTTGSDATAAAIRIARAYTRRQKILRFKEHYHSWHDWNRLVTFPFSSLEELGIEKTLSPDYISLSWNDIDAVRKCLKEQSREIAAVICEPMLGNFGCIKPRGDFLKELREITEEQDVILIFDEVVTGFRLNLGGAQKLFGVTPDIATFAKAMANGFPVAAVTGKREIMTVKALVGGTYNSNPVSVAAAIATIKELEREATYSKMIQLGRKLVKGIQEVANDAHVECFVQGEPTLFSIIFGKTEEVFRTEDLQQIPVYPHIIRCAKFYQEMINQGVFNMPSRFVRWCLSASHTSQDIEKTIDATSVAFKKIAEIKN